MTRGSSTSTPSTSATICRQQALLRAAARDAHRAHVHALRAELLQHVAQRTGDAFVQGAHEMPGLVAKGHADKVRAQQRVPMRRALALQVRVKQQAERAGRQRRGQGVHVIEGRRAVMGEKAVAQPAMRGRAAVGAGDGVPELRAPRRGS